MKTLRAIDTPLIVLAVLTGIMLMLSSIAAWLTAGTGGLWLPRLSADPGAETGAVVGIALGISLYREAVTEDSGSRRRFEWVVCGLVAACGVGVVLVGMASGTPAARFSTAVGSMAIAAGLCAASIAGLIKQARIARIRSLDDSVPPGRS